MDLTVDLNWQGEGYDNTADSDRSGSHRLHGFFEEGTAITCSRLIVPENAPDAHL